MALNWIQKGKKNTNFSSHARNRQKVGKKTMNSQEKKDKKIEMLDDGIKIGWKLCHIITINIFLKRAKAFTHLWFDILFTL